MFLISKRFEFSASHQLNHLPSEHPCSRLHGHNYIVEIEIRTSELDYRGFVVDYNDLKSFAEIVQSLDHHHLNDLLPDNPTAENIARWLFDKAFALWSQVSAIRVSETPKTWAEYRP